MYNDIIAPIFDARCVSCHNTKKKKGELLLTSPAAIEEGGENGAIFIAGNAEDSEVYRRLILDSDDDDRMPPTGRKPLSDDHINLIKWWVDSGATFDNTVAELTPPEDVRSILDRMSAEAEEAAFAIVVPPADPAALESLRDMGVLVMPLSQETNLLQAQFCLLYTSVEEKIHIVITMPRCRGCSSGSLELLPLIENSLFSLSQKLEPYVAISEFANVFHD